MRTLLLSLLGAGVFVALLGGLVDRILFQPSPGVDLDPDALGAHSLHLTSADGVRVHAFYLPAPGSSRALLFLHGNAGNASHRLPNAVLLRDLGIDVLLLDYRGYGLSEGQPSEPGLYLDARAGLEHLQRTRQIPSRRIVLFGRSLGGAVAVDLAQERELAGVILESTFTSLSDMAPWPLGGLLGRNAFDSIGKIPRVRAPLLFFHGDRDEVVPYALGRRLYEAAPAPRQFETLQGAGHNDTVERGGSAYLARIGRFLDEVAPEAAIR